LIPIDLKGIKARGLIPFHRRLSPARLSSPLRRLLSSPHAPGRLSAVLRKFSVAVRESVGGGSSPFPVRERFVGNVIGTAVRYRTWNERVPDTFTIGEQYIPRPGNFSHKMIYSRAISRAFYF